MQRRLETALGASFTDGTSEVIEQAALELDEYFAGRRNSFDIPLLFAGTDFQKTVWTELLNIPYGQTASYAEIARRIGRPEAVRAVGCLPRVGCLVLAGSLMGGSIVDDIDEIKNKYGVKVISLNMVGSVRDHADLVVTDPVQAGVMAVMSIAKTAKFDIDRVDEVL